MNVRELIDELSIHDHDMEVVFGYDYGDHWHTTVAEKVSEVEVMQVTHSAYHNKDKLVDPDRSHDRGVEARTVVFLR